MKSSLGFHTLMLNIFSSRIDTEQLLKHFIEFSEQTGCIQIYPDKHGNTIIKFHREDRGMEWMIKHNVWMNDIRLFVDFVYVTINPKILGGVNDYLTAATIDDMDKAIENFNSISQRISPLLYNFEQYSITRIDYCVNFSLRELAPDCSPDQMMNLIKRSDIPPSYREWMKYDETSHRMKSDPASFYLMNNSAHINIYSKYMQLLDRSKKNMERGYPSIPQKTLDAAYDIIRFEVQCYYRKTYSLSRKVKQSGNKGVNKYQALLTNEHCNEIINHYYTKTIGKGHWYSLQMATTLIKSHQFNKQKETRLIATLQGVNQCRSLAKAKASHQGHDLDTFKRSLNDLASIGINAVTIPKDWGIKRIWNLLETYHSKVAEEQSNKRIQEDFLLNYRDYSK